MGSAVYSTAVVADNVLYISTRNRLFADRGEVKRPAHGVCRRRPGSMSMYSLCQLTHDVRESRSADRTLGNQLSIVDNAEHAIGRRKLP